MYGNGTVTDLHVVKILWHYHVDAKEGIADAAGCRAFRHIGLVCVLVVDYAYADVHRVDADVHQVDVCASSVPEPSRQEAILLVKVWVKKFLTMLHKSQVMDRNHLLPLC